MTPENFLREIRAALDAYIASDIGGRALVRRIDDLMADELPDGLSHSLLEVLNGLQDELALYVEEASRRKEHPAYFGPEELTKKVLAAKQRLE